MKRILILLIISVFLFSCKHDVAGDIERPSITIFTPVENQHFVTGDTIRITGICRDNQELDEVPVHITDEDSHQEFFHNHYGLLHTASFSFDTYYVVTTTASTKYSIGVEAVDVAGHIVEKEVEVDIN
jgi:hypothetical protein